MQLFAVSISSGAAVWGALGAGGAVKRAQCEVVVGHAYFAYGSNLCTRQMVRRCPDATDPRPATLADHAWLINQRGVATVEPAAGARVHGLVWQISDDDLVVLDDAEGVPERYRRDELTVHTADGPRPAWVYVDHRIRPGNPRPGYVERIVDGAIAHRLPQPWVDLLRRWSPERHPVSNAQPGQSLAELLADPGVAEDSRLRSRFGFLAVHGGGLERMTDVIAERAADAAGASVYVLRHPLGYPYHLPSSRFRREESARLAAFLDHVDVAVSLHGYTRPGDDNRLLAGGGNRRLAAHLARHLDLPGYQVVTDLAEIPAGLRGLHPDNPVNRARGGGAQLELPPRVRGIEPRSESAVDPVTADLAPATAALVGGLAAAAQNRDLGADSGRSDGIGS